MCGSAHQRGSCWTDGREKSSCEDMITISYNQLVRCRLLLSPEDKGDVYVLLQAQTAPKGKENNTDETCSRNQWITCVARLCNQSSWVCACMHQSCLTMQSSTDGCVGGWVLSAHRSSCGSVVPLLFTAQARRARQTRSMETYQGWTWCVLVLLWCSGIFCRSLHEEKRENGRKINSAHFLLRELLWIVWHIYGYIISAVFIGCRLVCTDAAHLHASSLNQFLHLLLTTAVFAFCTFSLD